MEVRCDVDPIHKFMSAAPAVKWSGFRQQRESRAFGDCAPVAFSNRFLGLKIVQKIT
jgi:hypothetical protein